MVEWGHTFEEIPEQGSKEGKPSAAKPKGALNKSAPAHLQPPIAISRAQFIDLVKEIQTDYRGHELPGMYNPDHLTLVFRKQSHRWRGIAEAHLGATWAATYDFLREVAQYAAGAGNEHTAAALIRHIIEPEMKAKRRNLLEKLDEILRPIEKFPIMTHDIEFHKKRTELYGKLSNGDYLRLTRHIAAGHDKDTELFVKERLANYRLEKTEFPSDSAQILDLMNLYYEVCGNLFLKFLILSTISESYTDIF
jgi:hypothetical protein